jgi:MoaA/NifB/PqqE/SkfB family radical SAM enzyme
MKEKNIHVITSLQCNNNCVFCLDAAIRGKLDFISGANFIKDIECLDSYGGNYAKKRILFTSGEPTLHPDLPKLIAIAKEHNFDSIAVVTNGRRISYRSYLKKLIASGLNEIVVSIHGHDAIMHDSHTRTQGSFKQVVSGLDNLVIIKNKYKHKITINSNSTITKINKGKIIELLKFLFSWDIFNSIVLNIVIPKGNADTYFEAVVSRYSDLVKEINVAINFMKKNGYDVAKIAVNGVPLCTGANNISRKEKIMIVKHREKRDILSKNAGIEVLNLKESFMKIKRPKCRECTHFNICEGVWKDYIKKYSWKEFNPR